MGHFSFRHYCFLFLLISSSAAHAQWARIATGMFGRPITFNGVSGQFEYRDGVCWAGAQFTLEKSTDKGASWQKVGGTWDRITAIRFWDSRTGVLAHSTAGLDLTIDGGVSWRKIADIGNLISVTFGQSTSHILVATGDGVLARSVNQGQTWTFSNPQQFLFQVQRISGDTVIRQVGNNNTGTWIERSTDFGLTWTSPLAGPAAHYDSWMPAIDSCDKSLLYIANEEALLQTDRNSDIFRSTNGGRSWASVFKKPIQYLGGGIQATSNAVYAGALKKGIERSTDHGETWTNIGGPKMMFDCMPFMSLDDSVIVAIDTEGSLWRTPNAGGAPIPNNSGSLTASVDSIAFDSVAFCDAPVSLTARFFHDCTSLASVRIEGDTTFFIAAESGDSVVVSLRPRSGGHHSAYLVARGTHGETLRIPLTATTSAPELINASVAITALRNDTIGGTIRIPIATGSQGTFPGGSFDLSFDTSILMFVRALDENGNELTVDIQGLSSHTPTASIFFGQDVDTVFAEFVIFPQSTLTCTTVTVDSFASTAAAACFAVALQKASVEICANGGCGGALLSEFVRHQDILPLTISPNPAGSRVRLSAGFRLHVVRVYASSGELLLQDPATGDGVSLDLQTIPSGTLYIVAHGELGELGFGRLTRR